MKRRTADDQQSSALPDVLSVKVYMGNSLNYLCTLHKTYFFLAYHSNVLTTVHKNPPPHNIYMIPDHDIGQREINHAQMFVYIVEHTRNNLHPNSYCCKSPKYVKVVWLIEA